MNTYTYDSANRLISVNNTESYTYNGLGDRLSQNGVNYTLDLNAGLTQVLSDGTTSYTYGLGRISQLNTGTLSTDYFLGDALGSVRQLVNNTGEVTLAKSYDPYGVVTQSTGKGSSAYGYTGESQDVASGLVYLRSRYYNVSDGRFQSRDTWEGSANRPISMNRWNYVESNPVNLTDPTGKFPDWCKSMKERLQYENCVRRFYNLAAPKDYPVMPRQEGSPGCWSGAVAYWAPGYLEGLSGTVSFMASYSRGSELVFDFGTMEKGLFNYETAGISPEASITAMEYHGIIFGFNNVDKIEDKYRGPFAFLSSGLNSADFLEGISLGVGVVGFVSFDLELTGISEYFSIGGGITLLPGGSMAGGVGLSKPTGYKRSYIESDRVNFSRLYSDITYDPVSPAVVPVPSNLVKVVGIGLAFHYAWIHNEIHFNSK